MKLSAVTDVEITSAAPEELLNTAIKHGIVFSSIEYLDALHIRASVFNRDIDKLQKIIDMRADQITLLKRRGIQHTVKKILSRPILLIGMVLWLFLLLFLPTRVLFVDVVGNNAISAQQLIDCARSCGIYFGATRRDVRSEQVKNLLLGMEPRLQWVGVNTYGCRAVISVVEKTIISEERGNGSLYSIVASRDGIVSSVTVTKGNALCKVGQAVRRGQLLVSPYTDCGLLVKAESAEAEIFAQTNRKLTAVTPLAITKREQNTGENTRFSLRIGNKIINFYKDSGILDATCATMYTEKVLCLPGGFALPISLIRQTVTHSAQKERTVPTEQADSRLRAGLLEHLNSQMLSGKVQYVSCIPSQTQDCYYLQGNYICHEIIGKYHVEERLPNNG